MEYRELTINWIRWVDGVSLPNDHKVKILEKYGFHELDIEACLEDNQKARLDKYDDYLFMVLHFPKFNVDSQRHELVEFNVFIGKEYIITLRDFNTRHICDIFDKYKDIQDSKDENKAFKISSGFILYEIIQAMFEKMFKMSDNIEKDLRRIEDKVFLDSSQNLIRQIMLMKRNVIVLKHNFRPQITAIRQLELAMKRLFDEEIEAYFEDLEDKVDVIVNELVILEENISSLEDSYKSIVDMRTNFTIKVLTLFSSFFLPLTLITSFYWMNVSLPFQEDSNFVYSILWLSFSSMILVYIILKSKNKF